MKKIIRSFLAAVLVLGLLSGCGTGSNDAENNAENGGQGNLPLDGAFIGISPYWLDATNTIYCNYTKEYLESQGAEVEILDPNGDAATQRQQIQDWIAMGADGIIWSPVETSTAVELTRTIQNADVRSLIYWNTVSEDELGDVKVVQIENSQYEEFYEMGQAAVEYVKNEMNETPKAIIFDAMNNAVCHARATGFHDGLLAADPDAEILFMDEVDFEQDTARQRMLDLITTYPDFNIVAPHCGNASIGAYSAVQSSGRGRAGDEYFILCDCDYQKMDLLLDDSTSVQALMQCDVVNGGTEMGEKMGELLLDENWRDQTGFMYTPGLILTKEDKEGAVEAYEIQCGTLDDYEPIDLSQYE